MFFKCNLLIFCIFLSSCVDNMLVLPPHIPISAIWAQEIDRKISYPPNDKDVLFSKLIKVESDIHPSNLLFTKAPWSIIYENFTAPFRLSVNIELLDRNIDKIVFSQCTLKHQDGSLDNILKIPVSNFKFSWRANIGDRRWTYENISESIGYVNLIDLEKEDDRYIDKIIMGFRDLPFDYKTENELSMIYEFNIIFNNGETSIVNNEIKYRRTITELKLFHLIRNFNLKDELPHEINIEEWEKGLAYPKYWEVKQ